MVSSNHRDRTPTSPKAHQIANTSRFNLAWDIAATFDAAYQQLDAAAVNAALRKHVNPEQLRDAAAGSF